jgi:hypothetical protein
MCDAKSPNHSFIKLVSEVYSLRHELALERESCGRYLARWQAASNLLEEAVHLLTDHLECYDGGHDLVDTTYPEDVSYQSDHAKETQVKIEEFLKRWNMGG